MNIHPRRFIRPRWHPLPRHLATLQACNGDACFGVDACFNNNNTQTVALSGTAAKGGALASAQVTVVAWQGRRRR